MTEFIEGMTPAEFVAALNDNFTEYWGASGVAEILTTDGYVAAINTSFGKTTVAFGQSGMAFKNSLDKFNTFTHILEYSGNGTSIDLTKLDITNIDVATDVKFEQNNALLMKSIPSGVRVLMYRNQVRSVDTITYGACGFCLANIFRQNNWIRVGLSDATNQNRIELSAYGTNTLKYSIWEAGVEVYTTATGVIDFGQFQLVVSPIGKISAWILTNDVWVQIGTTQEYSLGSLKFYMSSEGAVAGLTSLTDIYITSRKYTTIVPGVVNETRVYGEFPDGVTDNAGIINNALASGNVYLKNGTFLITESIKNASNAILMGRNAKIRVADDSLDNIYRNSDFDGGNVNIGIRSYGNFLLDSNAANNDDGYETYSELEREDVWDWSKVGADMYHYFNIIFLNVVGFEITDPIIYNYPHWNIGLQHAKGISVTNPSIVKPQWIMYGPLLVPANTDGVDIMWGCENLEIKNIDMATDDDSVVIGCGRSDFAVIQRGPTRVGDIKNIKINNLTILTTSGRCLLFIVSDGNIVDNIEFSDIRSYSEYYCVLFGYPDYAIIPATKDEFKNITINNIEVDVNVNATVFKVNDDCKNIKMTNIVNNSGKELVAFESGLDIENFTINGVEYP